MNTHKWCGGLANRTLWQLIIANHTLSWNRCPQKRFRHSDRVWTGPDPWYLFKWQSRKTHSQTRQKVQGSHTWFKIFAAEIPLSRSAPESSVFYTHYPLFRTVRVVEVDESPCFTMFRWRCPSPKEGMWNRYSDRSTIYIMVNRHVGQWTYRCWSGPCVQANREKQLNNKCKFKQYSYRPVAKTGLTSWKKPGTILAGIFARIWREVLGVKKGWK